MATKASSTAQFEKGTGLSWAGWLAYLGEHKAEAMGHSEVVSLAVEKITELGVAEKVGWWAQGVAVTYGQHLGKRKPGQSVSGDWRVSASKTIALPGDRVLAAWEDFVQQRGESKEFNEVPMVGEGRSSVTPKWFYWRCDLTDGSKVSVNIQTKPDGLKSSVAIEQMKLAQGEAGIEPWKACWRSVLAEFAEFAASV